jgi:hypothetical protein
VTIPSGKRGVREERGLGTSSLERHRAVACSVVMHSSACLRSTRSGDAARRPHHLLAASLWVAFPPDAQASRDRDYQPRTKQ